MPERVFEEMKRYIGFDERDVENVRALQPYAAPAIPWVVQRFYDELLRHPGSRSVFEGPEQVDRLRHSLTHWLQTLFGGEYGLAYCRQRAQIGRVHVRVGLSQHYMIVAMQLIEQSLEQALRAAGAPDIEPKLASLRKLLSLELAIMLESYRHSYSDRLREAERAAVRERLTRAEHLAEIGQLAASLAHEIKNPLAGISGAIEVIRGSAGAQNPHRPVLDEILRQIRRLDRTVKDLLIYARPHPPRFDPCELPAVLNRVATLLRDELAEAHVKLQAEVGELPVIVADENQLEQVLVNLVQNAAHASPPGGSVTLRAEPLEDAVRVQVEDEGAGMSPELLRRAFEPFFTSKSKGTGLGLSICRKIIDAHGGTIDIESSPNAGTQVRIRLPLRPPEAESSAPTDDRTRKTAE